MPKKDGLYVLDNIKESKIDINVIVVTSYNEQETIRACLIARSTLVTLVSYFSPMLGYNSFVIPPIKEGLSYTIL